MASYSNLPKLGRVKLENNTTYALIDKDGRAMLAPGWNNASSYAIGDHVIYQDTLYRCKAATTGAWDATKWDACTVDEEIKRLEDEVTGGIHYRGKTTTALYDGCTTNPITIDGSSYTAEAGDLVLLNIASVAVTYATNTAYSAHTYLKHDDTFYITNSAITAAQNTSWTAISSKVDLITSEPKFLFDGTKWSSLGSISDGLGDLAYKDDASGEYVKPTGTGSVNINTYAPSTSKLVTTSIYGVSGSTSVAYISSVPTTSFAVAGDAVVYGTADVGTALSVGTSLGGTTTFVTTALYSASLTGTTTFNTDAIKGANLTGTTTFNTDAIKTSVDDDCLIFTAASTATVGISTTAASTATVSLSTTAAGASQKASVTLTTSSITPAKAADTTRKITGVSGTATGVTGVTYTTFSVPTAATSAITVATGALAADGGGATIVYGLSSSTTSATVNVGTTTDTVVVK